MVRVKQIVLFIYFLGLCSCNNTMQQGRSYRYYVGTMKIENPVLVEFDTHPENGLKHQQTVQANDPNAKVILKTVE